MNAIYLKLIYPLACATVFNGCAARKDPSIAKAPAQVGIVNHTEHFICSASVAGYGGGSLQ